MDTATIILLALALLLAVGAVFVLVLGKFLEEKRDVEDTHRLQLSQAYLDYVGRPAVPRAGSSNGAPVSESAPPASVR
jgi:hypothetical protein